MRELRRQVGRGIGVLGITWLTLFLLVASVPRCHLFASTEHPAEAAGDALEASCHGEKEADPTQAQLDGPPSCRCMLMTGLVFRTAEPEFGEHLVFIPHSQRELVFDRPQAHGDPDLDPDSPYPKSIV